MNWKIEALTPLLVGDGDALSPVDYMVWKDQVNVLDQSRIFKLLARGGSRLDGYLSQIRRAEKLDFANWGGFAQSYAGRRIPFEHASCTAVWNRLHAADCHIPSFAVNASGKQYLPGSALRGALRTALVAARSNEKSLADVERALEAGRGRRPAESMEKRALGQGAADQLTPVAVGDSSPVDSGAFQVYLTRVSTLTGQNGSYSLAWKLPGRGSVEARRVDDSGATFAEMARPGTTFTGVFHERPFYQQPEALQGLRWRDCVGARAMLAAANEYARQALDHQREYAEWTKSEALAANVSMLTERLAEAEQSGSSCLLALGWGTGLLGKSAWLKADDPAYRRVQERQPMYARALRSGLPFPKTRRVVFFENKPAALPGWVRLEIA